MFSICQGQIFLQPNKDSKKINLIQKPFRQPVNGLAIRYIIYRGILKSDFMGDDLIINPEGDGATGFVNFVRKEFKGFCDLFNITSVPEFTAEYLGYPGKDSPQKPEDLIDEYFFKVSKPDEDNGDAESHPFDFPIIPAGTFLGNTDGELGIDIVLNEGDYTVENDPNPIRLDISYARAQEYVLDASPYNGIQKKLIQETATQFMDIAAFYGLHTYGTGKIKAFSGSQETALQSAEEIYALLDGFQTKNTVYLYIQSNRQRSYNFYGNYNLNGNNI